MFVNRMVSFTSSTRSCCQISFRAWGRILASGFNSDAYYLIEHDYLKVVVTVGDSSRIRRCDGDRVLADRHPTGRDEGASQCLVEGIVVCKCHRSTYGILVQEEIDSDQGRSIFGPRSGRYHEHYVSMRRRFKRSFLWKRAVSIKNNQS